MVFAAPISRDGFSFAGDSFSVLASGHVHRRSTLPELKAHFKAIGSGKDQPGHWYEAQLLHYGLAPSKVKGTAKMRLMEAIAAGKMTVPASLTALEKDMKKEWTKANKATTAATSKPAGTRAKSGTKRKATDVQVVATGGTSVSVSVTVNHGADMPTAKKPKATPRTSSTKQSATMTSKSSTPKAKGPKTSASRTSMGDSSIAAPGQSQYTNALLATSTSSSVPRKQYARRGNPNFGGRIKDEPDFEDEDSFAHISSGAASSTGSSSHPRQTARCGNPSFGGRIKREPVVKDEFDEMPATVGLPPLGLINGRYEVVYMGFGRSYLNEDYRHLVCTIEGDRLWVSFDFKVVRGVMQTRTRPMVSDLEPLLFHWCGEGPDGRTYDCSHEASLTFVGGGVVEGTIEFACEV
ncbi:hypothetical protein CKAH01_16286 [Colletotrichum kahawae]|uniref:Uncharacterized protein n=1 Tax=Colletotrichum kahawae TaxID=34407 RepID=A0AAD9YDQ6_COLKA|nr:hypothetical protein CKAH01_16286 [Colletotrichum kahawae]